MERSVRCRRRRAVTRPAPAPHWDDLDVDPEDLVVIVGGAELGPYGSSRTRFEMEVDNELSAAGVLELAWTTGLVKWEDDPTRVGTTPTPVTWSTRASWWSATTMWSSSESASGSSSMTARSIPITPRRCWFRCSWKGLHVRGVIGGRCPGVRGVRSGAHGDRAGAGQWGLEGDPQGGHRNPRAAQGEAVAVRRRADPHRVRPEGLRRQSGHGERRSTDSRCGTWSPPSTRSCRPGSAPPS